MKHERILVYIAGPYTQGHTNENVRNAVLMGDALALKAFDITGRHAVVPVIPHLNHLWEVVVGKRDYDFWMDLDEGLLERCDAIVRLPGKSPGADREVTYAVDHGIAVYDYHGPLDPRSYVDQLARELLARFGGQQ